MDKKRKITVQVPVRDLAMAQQLTGGGVTDAVRTALRGLVELEAQQAFRRLRGTFRFSIDLKELRKDRRLPTFLQRPAK